MNDDIDEEDLEELDRDVALAIADPDDYAQNQRVRAIYQKRGAAYEALTDWPGSASRSRWKETKRGACHAAANYALDCLELADRLDEELTVDSTGPAAEKFEEKYGDIRRFAIFGGETLWKSEPVVGDPVSCRLVIAACDRFMAQIGLAGHIDPGKDVDAGFDYDDLLEEGPPDGSTPDIETAETD